MASDLMMSSFVDAVVNYGRATSLLGAKHPLVANDHEGREAFEYLKKAIVNDEVDLISARRLQDSTRLLISGLELHQQIDEWYTEAINDFHQQHPENPSPLLEVMSKFAQLSAQMLLTFEAVEEVSLFGSIARQERYPGDVDLIAAVPEYLYQMFIRELAGEYSLIRFTYTGEAEARAKAAHHVFFASLVAQGIGIRAAYDRLHFLRIGKVDIFLFPSNWKDRQEELQDIFGTEDPQFLANLARDARVYLPDEGQFEPLSN